MLRLLAFSGWILLAGGASGSEREPLTCVTEMEMPSPQGATVNIPGEVRAIIRLGPRGELKTLEVQSGAKALANEVEYLLRKATKYSSDCAGAKLEFTFVYEVEGDPRDSVSGRVVFQPPNRFVIISRPFIPIAEVHKR